MADLYTKGTAGAGSAIEYDRLIYDITIDQRVKGVSLASGQGVLKRGTVLGIVTVGGATAAAKAGGNTGNGTLTLDSSTPIRAGAKVGIFTVRCITAAADGGVFRVSNSDGYMLGDVAVGATFNDQIKFSIADGSQDFIVGDGFDITVAAGAGTAKVVNSANVDGSGVADCILTDSVDTGSGDPVPAEAYSSGSFNRQALTFGGSDTAAKHEYTLRGLGIYLSDKIPYAQV